MPTPAAPSPSPRAPSPYATGSYARVRSVRGLLRRAGDALAHGFHAPGRHAPRPARQTQWLALMSVLDDAVAAQPRSDQIVTACGETGSVPGSVAQTGGRQITVYQRLTVRLRRLDLDEDLAEIRARAARLLASHQWMLHQAMTLTFTEHRDDRIQSPRLRLNELGAPGDGLRQLRDEVHERAAHAGQEGVSL